MLRSVVRLLVPATVLAQSLEGQVVRGVARDADTDRLIESGVVTLLDESGAGIRAVLTDSLGRFAVLAPAAGAYRVRFERLGYTPITTDRFTLKAGETTSRSLKPTAISVSLAEIVVTDRPRCRILGEADTVTARVWTAVRSVLASAAAADEGLFPHVTIERYERDYDFRNRLVNESKWTNSGASKSPFIALAASELERHGFVKRLGDSVEFYAPDAGTLIAEEFLRTHCFRVRDERTEQGRIGLEIEPVPGREVPEIKGTLWVDASSGELRRLEFVFVNLPPNVPRESSDGWVEFMRTPRGAWLVDKWALRLPLVGERRSSHPYGANPVAGEVASRGTELLGVHEEGGRIVSLEAQGTTRRARPARRVAIRGMVKTPEGDPVPGARAFLSGTSHSSVTDREGVFAMLDVTPGEYRLSFTHPRFDTLGIVGPAIDIDGRAPSDHVLTMPTDDEIARAACVAAEGSLTDAEAGLLYGYVRDGASPAVVPGAAVTVAWKNLQTQGTAVVVNTKSLVTEADAEGYYQLCGVPTDMKLTVRVARQSRQSLDVPLGPLGGVVTRFDVELPRARGRGR
jgi:hypothetical protein